MQNAANKILKFIKAMDSPYGQALEREIAGMDADQQLDRVTQALATIRPTEAKAPETPGSPKAFFDELRAATEELNRATQRLKSELEK